jgi:hypothetical protein
VGDREGRGRRGRDLCITALTNIFQSAVINVNKIGVSEAWN